MDADITSDYSQQSVSDCIILTDDMFDGCGILRNVGQMSAPLAKQLVVGTYHKIAGLQEIPEVTYCQVDSQQFYVKDTVFLFWWMEVPAEESDWLPLTLDILPLPRYPKHRLKVGWVHQPVGEIASQPV